MVRDPAHFEFKNLPDFVKKQILRFNNFHFLSTNFFWYSRDFEWKQI